MSFLGDTFSRAFGRPDPAVPPALPLAAPNVEWESVKSEVGAGYFLDRFLYLFGPGLGELTACLDAWSFLVPASARRMVIGRNAYGALLVLENGDDAGRQRVCMLDPVAVRYWTNPNVVLLNLCGNYLPRNRLPGFLDRDAYAHWRAANGDVDLEVRDILGLRAPVALGAGKLEPDNLMLCDIVEYYQATAPAYEQAYRDVPFTGHPEFATPQPLTSSRTWTGEFDSYDQRNEWVYYIIARQEGGKEVDRLLARLDAWRGGMSPNLPVYAETVRRELESLARSGQSSVPYRGTLTRGGWQLAEPR